MRHEVQRGYCSQMQIGISDPINRDSLSLIVVILVPDSTGSGVHRRKAVGRQEDEGTDEEDEEKKEEVEEEEAGGGGDEGG
ncbi:hypothetical protein ALC60_06340 [Trachymyrmex zeteki]|uniref:Uncharacterized protein n=1 Tax=Mycetomoellerius zeteki TaxID=64791 RepID=A0A151X3F0_9HYME|nr:hypothetical protein ALC60_06340 [Trachymyrmex zeteki]